MLQAILDITNNLITVLKHNVNYVTRMSKRNFVKYLIAAAQNYYLHI